MEFIDLFCGIGGFRKALEEENFNCVFSSDIDVHAAQNYLINFGDNPLNDITRTLPSEIPQFDILCAGFPCQPFSIAGYRKGFDDDRGNLIFHIIRILNSKKPKAFILENVKGLISHNKGKTLNEILNLLAIKINGITNKNASKDCLKYHVFFKVLNSKDFGLAQNRERIFIVGLKSEGNFEFPSNLSKEIKLTDIIIQGLDKDVSVTAEKNIDFHLKKHKLYGEIKDLDYLLASEIRRSRCLFRYDNKSPTLTAKMGTGGNNVPVLVKFKRRLSIRECLRLHGYPEDFILKGAVNQCYKQLGNTVSVPVVKALVKELKIHIK